MNKQREFIELVIKFIAEEKAVEKKKQPAVYAVNNNWQERYWTLKPLHASQDDRRRV